MSIAVASLNCCERVSLKVYWQYFCKVKECDATQNLCMGLHAHLEKATNPTHSHIIPVSMPFGLLSLDPEPQIAASILVSINPKPQIVAYATLKEGFRAHISSYSTSLKQLVLELLTAN